MPAATAKAKKDGVVTATTPTLSTQMDIRTMTVRLVGDSPLVSHAWSQKAKQAMKDKQAKAPKQAKEVRDPNREYEESLYRMPDGSGYGFPAVAFKSAAVDACSHVDGLTKVQARGAFHIIGDMIRIDGTPHMREDMVRVGMGTADLRYRGEFTEWAVELEIRYNANVLSEAQIRNLFNVGGFAIGVGEWRPQRDGSWGMFHVE
jgi:hypothetical protein